MGKSHPLVCCRSALATRSENNRTNFSRTFATMPTASNIKLFRSLRDKTSREETSLFVAETPKVVTDLLRSGLQPEILYVTKDAVESWQERFPEASIEPVSPSELERLSFLKQPHEVSAIFRMMPAKPFAQQTITLILDGISDPGNMGTIIRSAHWFGVRNIVCTDNCVDRFNPKVVQSTMGSLAKVNVFYQNPELIRTMFDVGTHFYGTFMNGSDILATQIERPAAIIIGSEAHGIQSLENLVQHRIAIVPARNADRPESLNASVAASILLHHVAKLNG